MKPYDERTGTNTMLYQIADGTLSLEGKEILSHIQFEIKHKEKIALVGANGAGKTTLLRLIAGELSLDRDDKRQGKGITTSRKLSIGMLSQTHENWNDKTIDEIVLEQSGETDIYSRERYYFESEYNRIFTGFGFQKEDRKKAFGKFSGGEQTKIAMIHLLLQKPDILLLDEPTNHLDIETTEWLEEYMKSYENAVIFVSHDRFFLDRIVEVVYELQGGKLKRYAGNYTQYRQQKVKELAIARKNYQQQQEELERLNGLVEIFKNKPKKAAFARSRKKIIERMELMEKPLEDDVYIFTGQMEPKVLGSKWMLETEHLKFGYDRVLMEITLRVKRGQKIGIIGENGIGKTTFLKTIAGILPPISGKCTLGNRTELGYFDQQTAAMESELTVYEHFQKQFPSMLQKDVRQTLGHYLFGGKQAQKKVSELSGGEKSRLMLAEILTGRPNFLILDEPTNHMDLQAKETLESAFRSYTGTIVFISHDRYFISQVADAILVFTQDGAFYYPFGYEHYSKRRRQKDGESLSAMVQAQDQALIADMRAVPKAERHRLKEQDTEEAYLEWKLRLAKEQLEEAEWAYAKACEEAEAFGRQQMLLDLYGEECPACDNAVGSSHELEEKLECWTEKCMEWYEIYDEFTEVKW